MKNNQDNTGALSALLRAVDSVDTLVTTSFCCAAAAGIIDPFSATTDALIPHEKLRGAALADATLNAQKRPLAQPVVGYVHALDIVEWSPEEKTGRSDGPTDLIGRAA
jgi:hypothetical protein